MPKKAQIEETEKIVYNKLVKFYPTGMNYNLLLKKLPKTLRKYIKRVIKNLINKGMLSYKNHKYYVINIRK